MPAEQRQAGRRERKKRDHFQTCNSSTFFFCGKNVKSRDFFGKQEDEEDRELFSVRCLVGGRRRCVRVAFFLVV